MRKIKFRGQTVDTKELIYGDLIQTEKDFKNVVEILDWSKVGCKPEKSLVVNPETVGQFTGMTDKNGTKIFEGDIVKYYNPYSKTWHTQIVKWDWRFAGFGLFDKESEWCKENDWMKIKDIEIIGNIYDNPELL